MWFKRMFILNRFISMKRFTIFSLAFVCFIFSSCKKNSKVATPVFTPQPYGELTALKSFTNMSGTLSSPTQTGYADFRADIHNTNFMSIGSVWANGVKFQFQPSNNNTNMDSTYNMNIIPTTWQVNGSGPIPSFTYTNNDSLPGYTGYALMPDTIYKGVTNTLQVNGISNADAIEVSFYNSTINCTNLYQFRTSGITTNNTFSGSASSLSVLPSGNSSPTLLIVSVFKYNTQVIGGVTFKFVSQLEVNKLVYIK